MKVVQQKLDYLFLKSGEYNRYQFIILTLFTLQFLCSQFFHVNFAYITSEPFIKINGTEIQLNSVVCEEQLKGQDPISFINENKDNQLPSSTIIIDYDLACETTKIYFLQIAYYLSNIFGACLAYHFYEKINSKLSLNLFTLIQIIGIFLLEFINIEGLKQNIYYLYILLFIIGFSQYVVVIILFLYICDIIKLGQIPFYITIIVSGRYLASLLGVLFFEYFTINWKHDMAIIAGFNLIILIILFFYMEKSPKAALKNNKYMNFVKNLLSIARKNNKSLKKQDFDFLLPFMSVEEKIEYEGYFNLFSRRNIKNRLLDDNLEENDLNEDDEENEYKDLMINSSNKENERKTVLKDEYLMSDENNKIGSVNTLFSKVKMSDYSFFDFFKIKSHSINFSVLSFLWAVYNFIKYGVRSAMNEIPEYYNHWYWRLLVHLLELATLFCIMLIYIVKQSAFHRILISIELLSFIFLALSEYLDDDKISVIGYLISLVIAQTIWNSLYLLLIIIALLIYPIMLRSKGLGWNIGLGILGKLVVTFVIDKCDRHDYISYFLVFCFLMLVFSNKLPIKMGSLKMDVSEKEKDKKDKKLKEDNEEDMENSSINIKDKNELKNFSLIE